MIHRPGTPACVAVRGRCLVADQPRDETAIRADLACWKQDGHSRPTLERQAKYVLRLMDDVPVLLAQHERDTAEIERLRDLLARVAAPATRYDSRVYRLTDDYDALVEWLSPEDIALADERPGTMTERLVAERDAERARADKAERELADLRRFADNADVARRETHRKLNTVQSSLAVERTKVAAVRMLAADAHDWVRRDEITQALAAADLSGPVPEETP